MKNCEACNQQLALEVKFCPECGAKQKVQEVEVVPETSKFSKEDERFPAIYIATVVLSIAFCSMILLITFWYVFVGSLFDKNSTQIMGIVWAIASIGTIVGAIMMIRKKLKGLHLYTISQVVFIISAIVELMLLYNNIKTESLAMFLFIILFIPSVTFLIVFWVSKLRKHLS